MIKDVAVYDVEVLRGPDEIAKGWGDPQGMGFGTAVVYLEREDLYRFYGPGDLNALKMDLEDRYLVGFNSVHFDNKVIYGNRYRRKPLRERKGRECDLFLRAVCSKFGVDTLQAALKKFGPKKVFNNSCGLDAIAKATIGKGKTGTGEHAPKLIKRGQWADVFAYNLNDVRRTYQLYCFARENGFLIDGSGFRIPISVPSEES